MKKEGKKYLSKERLQKTVSHKSSLLKKKKKKHCGIQETRDQGGEKQGESELTVVSKETE